MALAQEVEANSHVERLILAVAGGLGNAPGELSYENEIRSFAEGDGAH